MRLTKKPIIIQSHRFAALSKKMHDRAIVAILRGDKAGFNEVLESTYQIMSVEKITGKPEVRSRSKNYESPYTVSCITYKKKYSEPKKCITDTEKLLRMAVDTIFNQGKSSYNFKTPELCFCKTDDQKKTLLIAKYRAVENAHKAFLAKQKYHRAAKDRACKPFEAAKKDYLQKKLDDLETALRYRETIYTIRTTPGSKKEHTWMPFWRDNIPGCHSGVIKKNQVRLLSCEIPA